MLNIIISLDYEIFGEGKGDVKKHIITPSDNLFGICSRYEVPITIMFEVSEYIKFMYYERELTEQLGYSPAELMRDQVREAYKGGHDVQLHLHPQWSDARYEKGKWIISVPSRIMGDLTPEEAFDMIWGGKEALKNMLMDVDAGYVCNTVRFTGYDWIEAPANTYAAMQDTGIKAHSLSDTCPFDNKRGYWQLVPGRKLCEIPIYSVELPKYRLLTPRRLAAALLRGMSSGPRKLAGKIADKARDKEKGYKQKWDFCKQSAKEMLEFLDVALERYDHVNNEVPLVMIGHSKDFSNEKEFDVFLKTVKEEYLSRADIRFTTFKQFVKNNIG